MSSSMFHTIPVANVDGETIDGYTVPHRYTDLKYINAGSQGFVASAHDAVEDLRVVIKKLIDPFGRRFSEKEYQKLTRETTLSEEAKQKKIRPVRLMTQQRTFREIKLLSSVNHPNVIKFKSMFTDQQTVGECEEIYLVMECMQYSLRQILCAANHLHRQGIIHRDLKPENIAFNNDDFEAKILNFGLARLFDRNDGGNKTRYVVTRYYRAPEVVLGGEYAEKVDVWSIGCIFAEMITSEKLFKGEHTVDQWNKIVQIMGTPSETYISQFKEPYVSYVRSLPRYDPIPFENILRENYFKKESEKQGMHWTAADAIRLIKKMLTIDENDRCTILEALEDPYVRHWHKEEQVNAPLSNCCYDRGVNRNIFSEAELLTRIFDEVKWAQSAFGFRGV